MLLTRRGADVNVPDKDGSTALIIACRAPCMYQETVPTLNEDVALPLARALVHAGADLDRAGEKYDETMHCSQNMLSRRH